VASCILYGLIGGTPSDSKAKANAFIMYSMGNLPENNYIYIYSSLAESFPLQLTTVKDLIKFVDTAYFFTLNQLI